MAANRTYYLKRRWFCSLDAYNTPPCGGFCKKIKLQSSAFPQCLILSLILVNEAAEGKRLVSPLPQDLCSCELNAFHDASTVAIQRGFSCSVLPLKTSFGSSATVFRGTLKSMRSTMGGDCSCHGPSKGLLWVCFTECMFSPIHRWHFEGFKKKRKI